MNRILAAGALCLALVGAGCARPGTIDQVEIVNGESTKFSPAEIEAAEEAVMAEFRDLEGCVLLELGYDEEFSDSMTASYTGSGGEGRSSDLAGTNAILLRSVFHVSKYGHGVGLNPDTDYTDWPWILTRDDQSAPWEVVPWGR
ncbi:MAG: hypothetical protein LBK95_01075 [Bifidobacteriaceae bacterium]|nr:hypothetical protein [Bifidobacteriaceae bacterium]